MEKIISFKKIVNIPNCSNILKFAAGSALCCIFVYAGKIWYAYRFFDKMKIRTPKRKSFIYGNLDEIIEKVK